MIWYPGIGNTRYYGLLRCGMLFQEVMQMKKFLVSLALALTVLSGAAALAVDSPSVTPPDTPGTNPDKSPKTADVSTFAFAGAGVLGLGGVVFCATKARNE